MRSVLPLGIDDWKGDVLFGVGMGALFIFMSIIGGFSFVLPTQFFDAFQGTTFLSLNVGMFISVVLLAPLIEEAVFRGILLPFLVTGLNMDLWFALVLQAGAFSVAHLSAYAGVELASFSLQSVFAVTGAFISAFIFGVVIGYFAFTRKNYLVGVLPHAMINFWLVKGQLFLVG